ncbi:MAG: hypothetical protein KDK40_04790 [Chlamydiia bacterium]|nr:hypothetical protein [Chlamydiia bacterium]
MSSPTEYDKLLAQRLKFLNDPESITWYDRLNYKTGAYNPSVESTAVLKDSLLKGISASTLNTMLDEWSLTNVDISTRDPAKLQVFPRTWEGLAAAIDNKGGDSKAAYEAFKADFLNILSTNSTGGGDWTLLNDKNFDELFKALFKQFLFTYPFTPVQITGATGQDSGVVKYVTGDVDEFLKKWRTFMTVTAVQLTGDASGSRENVAAYEKIFYAFFPKGTQENFQTLLNKFEEQVKASDQFFSPSQQLNQWLSTVVDQYLASKLASDSVAGTHANKIQIIWRLFQLVVDMIGTIQQATAAMAGFLKVLTTLQKAYTDLMTKVPTFIKGQSIKGIPDGDSGNQQRADLNDKGKTLLENLRSLRSLLTDESKQVQSTVNQLNEGVNQQANLATALLQQMSGILQSIYR